MAFKMGNKPLPGIAHGGNIKKKHGFKIEHKKLDDGITAEAISADKIVIDKDVPKDSQLYKEAVAHEGVHAKEMGEGKIAYGDDYVRDGNKTYHRKDGKIKYNGKWKDEGDHSFPWEKRAMKAEKNV
jgi:hypothetical protein|tara:strand:+ start:84 stop:464 length:381 start_codon:yes stop_codon:yes gene_type:complete